MGLSQRYSWRFSSSGAGLLRLWCGVGSFGNSLHVRNTEYSAQNKEWISCFVDRASLYNLLQIEPTWCTNFLNMLIAFLYMFRATMCPSSGENTVPMRHLVFVTLYRWQSGMHGGIPDSHPYRVTNTRCRIGTVFSPDDGHIVARNIYSKAINILKKLVHQVGSIYRTKTELTCL